jgi:hypothetical protein
MHEMDVSSLEARMWREGDPKSEFMGTIHKHVKGIYIVQFRPIHVGMHLFNIYVKGQLEKKSIYDESNPVRLNVIEGSAHVVENLHFSISGPGLKGAQIGTETQFQIDINGDDKQPRDIATDKLSVVVEAGSSKLTAHLNKKSAGRFTANYRPNSIGAHTVRVMYAGKEACSSQVYFDNGVDPRHSEIRSVPRFVSIGEQVSFAIQVKSQQGFDIKRGGERFDCAVSGPENGVQGLVVRDESTGIYTVRFKLVVAGQYKFFISLKNVDLRGSPFMVTVS